MEKERREEEEEREVQDMREGSLGTLRNRGTRNWNQFKNQTPKFTTKYLYDSMAESQGIPFSFQQSPILFMHLVALHFMGHSQD